MVDSLLPAGGCSKYVLLKLKFRAGLNHCVPCSFVFLRQGEMSSLSAASVEASPAIEGAEQKKPLKPCCACPETKKARDAWLGNSLTSALKGYYTMKMKSYYIFLMLSQTCMTFCEAQTETF